MSSDSNGKYCILIKGPNWGDAGFYGPWLSTAGRAETFWKEARKDPDFEKQVEMVCYNEDPDFGISASLMVMQLKEYRTTLVLNAYNEDDFVMMVMMGFFAPTNLRYRMTIPSDLTVEKVKGAVLKYGETEDEEYALHPEYFVNTTQLIEARAWQNRLRALDQFHNGSNVFGHA